MTSSRPSKVSVTSELAGSAPFVSAQGVKEEKEERRCASEEVEGSRRQDLSSATPLALQRHGGGLLRHHPQPQALSGCQLGFSMKRDQAKAGQKPSRLHGRFCCSTEDGSTHRRLADESALSSDSGRPLDESRWAEKRLRLQGETETVEVCSKVQTAQREKVCVVVFRSSKKSKQRAKRGWQEEGARGGDTTRPPSCDEERRKGQGC